VPPTQPSGPLQVRVDFDSGPLAGRVQAMTTVEVIKEGK
jgi:hypothetical protein